LDAEVWARSQRAQAALLAGSGAPDVEDFVWFAAKSWGKVQGIVGETRPAAASVLLAMEWRPELFGDHAPSAADEDFAVSTLARFVRGVNAQGIKRKEFSAGSKILHWLMPWRVPIYDNVVREMLGVPQGPPSAATYRQIVRWELGAVGALLSSGDSWIGSSEPRAALRALDKYLWWAGGGKDSRAAGARCS
jgi:hypothetical protein